MTNQLVLVGRLTDNIKIEQIDDDKYMGIATLAVPRSWKNADGEYETDFITVYMFGNIASNTNEFCEKGDLIGIKGRVESTENDMRIIAEKITFLSSKTTSNNN